MNLGRIGFSSSNSVSLQPLTETPKSNISSIERNFFEAIRKTEEKIHNDIDLNEKTKAFLTIDEDLRKKVNVCQLDKINWLSQYITYWYAMIHTTTDFLAGNNIEEGIREKHAPMIQIFEKNVHFLLDELNEKIGEVRRRLIPLQSPTQAYFPWVSYIRNNLSTPKDILNDNNLSIDDLVNLKNQISNANSKGSNPNDSLDRARKLHKIFEVMSKDNPEQDFIKKCKDDSRVLLEQRIDEMAILLKVSEGISKPINEITQKDIDAFNHAEEIKKEKEKLEYELLLKQQQADKCMAELLETEEKERQTRAATGKNIRRRSNKKTSSKSNSAKSKQTAIQPPRLSGKTEVVQKNFKVEFLANLSKQAKFNIELDRVTKRWKTNDPNTIKQFEDRDANHQPVHRYARLSDNEIATQRAKHYLPGTEILLGDQYAKSVYSFPTDKGFGMFAKFTINNQSEFGVIYFGVGNDRVIFHKYFTPMTEAALDARKLLRDSQTDIYSTQGNQGNSNGKGEEEDWKSNLPFTVDTDQTGVMRFQFFGETHAVRIFPIRKDLMRNELYS